MSKSSTPSAPRPTMRDRFGNASIRTKILQLVASGLVASVVVGALGVGGMLQGRASLAQMAESSERLNVTLMELNDAV